MRAPCFTAARACKQKEETVISEDWSLAADKSMSPEICQGAAGARSIVIDGLNSPRGIRRARAFHSMPEDPVEGVFGALVGFRQRQAGGDIGVFTQHSVGDFFGGWIELIERNVV